MERDEEYTFLCGYQRIRRYGSTNDLNSPPAFRKYISLVVHKVESTDTLQSIELKYNSCRYEIKRLNKLWSNDSLHCKTYVNIPIYDPKFAQSPTTTATTNGQDNNSKHTRASSIGSEKRKLEAVEEVENESLHDIFKRIDKNMKMTQKAVKKLTRGHSEIT
uniref:LysM domain-containing protein n=1 Tax=Acrobeloides nanus TaxID=290746 RepID=A0A914CXE4_9BILA